MDIQTLKNQAKQVRMDVIRMTAKELNVSKTDEKPEE